MAQIDVTINGRQYPITCDDGQEEHILHLAQYIDTKMAELVVSVGQVGDTRLLVLAALTIADELAEAYAKIDEAADADRNAGQAAKVEAFNTDSRAAAALSALAERIEGIAARLEAA